MKSAIEEMFFGKRGYYDAIKPSDEYQKIYKTVSKNYDGLERQLNKKQKAKLDELYSSMGLLSGEYNATHFKEGFKLGLLVAIEVFLVD